MSSGAPNPTDESIAQLAGLTGLAPAEASRNKDAESLAF